MFIKIALKINQISLILQAASWHFVQLKNVEDIFLNREMMPPLLQVVTLKSLPRFVKQSAFWWLITSWQTLLRARLAFFSVLNIFDSHWVEDFHLQHLCGTRREFPIRTKLHIRIFPYARVKRFSVKWSYISKFDNRWSERVGAGELKFSWPWAIYGPWTGWTAMKEERIKWTVPTD